MRKTTGRLDNKIAVVTGGTQGLGAEVARLFAERGAKGLVICGRSRDKGEAKAREITERYGTPVHFVSADLGEVADCRRVIAAADEKFGRIDALVNVAAITDRGTILDTDEALFDRMFAINTRAPFFLIQDAVKLMLRDGVEGTIVNISSRSSMAGQPFIAALLRLQRRAGHADPQCRLRPLETPHPQQCAEYRLDGERR